MTLLHGVWRMAAGAGHHSPKYQQLWPKSRSPDFCPARVKYRPLGPLLWPVYRNPRRRTLQFRTPEGRSAISPVAGRPAPSSSAAPLTYRE